MKLSPGMIIRSIMHWIISTLRRLYSIQKNEKRLKRRRICCLGKMNKEIKKTCLSNLNKQVFLIGTIIKERVDK